VQTWIRLKLFGLNQLNARKFSTVMQTLNQLCTRQGTRR